MHACVISGHSKDGYVSTRATLWLRLTPLVGGAIYPLPKYFSKVPYLCGEGERRVRRDEREGEREGERERERERARERERESERECYNV